MLTATVPSYARRQVATRLATAAASSFEATATPSFSSSSESFDRNSTAVVKDELSLSEYSKIIGSISHRINNNDVVTLRNYKRDSNNATTTNLQISHDLRKSLSKSTPSFLKNTTSDRSKMNFRVTRTVNGNLPVYECFKKGGQEAYTQLRHVEGDQQQVAKMLLKVCEAPVRVRTGAFEVKGVHSWKIKEWLASLGF